MTKWPRARIQITSVLAALVMGWVSPGQAQGWELRVCAETDSLPYSNELEEGFENRIAEMLAEELGAQLSYVWLPQPHARARDVFIQEGRCDLVIGIPDGHSRFLTSLAYYRTTYVFVHRKDSPYEIDSFDDPDLTGLKIGVQVSGGSISPASFALAKRELIDNQVGFGSDSSQADPFSAIIRAVIEGEVGVAVVWGPIAGYFAKEQPIELVLTPVRPQIEMPFVSMVAPISVGVRLGDEALRDEVNTALVQRWDDIQGVLEDYGVPLEPLSKPTLKAGGP